jgi:hypothetical protein
MRRRGFISTAMRMSRALERQQAARQRELLRQQRAVQQAEALRERQQAALTRDAKRLYVEQQNSEAIRLSGEMADHIKVLGSTLSAGLDRNSRVDLEALRQSYHFFSAF